MIQCPECRKMIPDDSAYCDQCGKELKWCPQCKRPKRGTECPLCGSVLVPGRQYLGGGSGVSGASGGAAGGFGGSGGASRGGSGGSGVSGVGIVPTALVGNGWRLILQEGPFGRTGGIWPELASCRYVSGNHGRISKTAAGWQVEDCGSTNGTFVNGVRIQKQILKRGDILRIATLDFTID